MIIILFYDSVIKRKHVISPSSLFWGLSCHPARRGSANVKKCSHYQSFFFFLSKTLRMLANLTFISPLFSFASADVEFCGYTITHPSESKINFRIQTRGGIPAAEPLRRGLNELSDVCQHVLNTFQGLFPSQDSRGVLWRS
uniref:RNA polymerase I and III subunit D n=1 Tax=Oreochromis niloticus TaxID=8128 RepID=A0A669BG99_ORENI